jgi:prolyl 4-hydroxylase
MSAMQTTTTLWGHPEAALDAMRAGCWDLDAALSGLQSELTRQALAERVEASMARTLPDLDVEHLRNAVQLGSRTVRVVLALSSPRLVLLDGVLGDDECDALIQSAQPRLTRSTTVGAVRTEITEARTSRDAPLTHEPGGVSDRVDQRLHDLFGWPRAAGERLQVVHYGPGEEFTPHYDYFDPGMPEARTARQRLGTVICYLNDPPSGGHTDFPDIGLRIAPRRGSALFFNYEQPSPRTRTLHAGLPVLEGAKWIATKWFTHV